MNWRKLNLIIAALLGTCVSSAPIAQLLWAFWG